MPKEVQALRSSLDSRLTALEQALADPKQHSSLETLILDLARLATEEADATARHAVLDAEKAGQDAAAAARIEGARALEAEQGESAALREVIEQAKSALKQAEAALKEERRTAEAANREVAGAHRELGAIRESLEQHQAASVNQRRELEAALASVDTERARASAMEQQITHARAEGELARAAIASELAEARGALDSERAAGAQLLQTSSELEQQLATVRGDASASRSERDSARRDVDTLRAELDAARRDVDTVRAELDAVRRELESMRGELESTRGERDSTRDERDAARRDLDGARRELDGARQDTDARTQTLSRSHAEQELALKTAQDGARGAEAQLEQAIRERDDAHNEAAALKAQLHAVEGAIRERDDARNEAAALKAQLHAAEGVTRERDALKRELEAAHEARDAAETLAAVRRTEPQIEFDADSETVVDLTSITKEEERQLAIENRIRALELALRDAETRAESAEVELDLQRSRAPDKKAPPQVELTAAKQAAESAQALPSEVTDGTASEQFRGAAKRVQFKGETDIQVDGTPGKLVDLSLTGAQLLTATAMKPNRLIKVTLPIGDKSIACNAKVMWSRLEPRSGQLWYRAGVSFTSSDQLALERFLDEHQK